MSFNPLEQAGIPVEELFRSSRAARSRRPTEPPSCRSPVAFPLRRRWGEGGRAVLAPCS